MNNDKYVEIGKILKPHGINGQLKIVSYSNEISSYDTVYIDEVQYKILSLKKFNQFFYIKLSEINCIEKAEKLRGKYIKVKRQSLSHLSDGEYYIVDIIDCKIVLKNNVLGKVVQIDNYGSADVYTCIDGNKKIFRFPFLKEIIIKVDIINKTIIVNDRIKDILIYED